LNFGSIGAPELILIMLLALLVLGPRRLPEVGRALGKAAAGFRRATADFKAGIEKEVDLRPIREAQQAIQRARRDVADLASAPARVLKRELIQEAETDEQAPAEPRPDGPDADETVRATEPASPSPGEEPDNVPKADSSSRGERD
jgi:Tat protein translocase TatB subunit